MNYRIAFFPILAFAAIGFGSAPYCPNCYQQNDWFAEYGENIASYVNPASISEADQIEVGAALYRTLSGQAGQEFVTAVHPLGMNHTLGVTYFENGSQIDGSNASYLENAYSLSYALRMPSSLPAGIAHKLSVGVNATVFQYDPFGAIDGKVQYSFGGDVGLSYNPFTTSRYGQLLVGVAVQNVLQPSIKMQGGGSYDIPRNVNTSLFWRGLNRRLELAGSATMFDISGSGGFAPTARATYYVAPWAGLKVKYSKQGYPIIGATANVQRLNLFRYLQFDLDMSHDALADDNGAGFIWNFRAIARIGSTREDQFGTTRYERLKVEPEEAYREGMRLYLSRQFLSAAYQFGKVVSKYPTFHLVDQAAYYKGKSFENLRMHKAATEVYEEALRKFSDSELRPKYMFQLMNIKYKDGKYADASRLHQQLVNLYPESDVKPDADYVKGQIKYIQRDYEGAIPLLASIPAGNSNYPYARYTLAMSYASLKKMPEAEAAFKDVHAINPANSSEQEMKDLAAVKLGHISFGKPQLKQAAEYYGSVSSTSSKYDEALMGLAWAFLKEKNFKGTADYANAILTKTPNSVLVPEAHLLLGYCLYFDKNTTQALAEFDKVLDLTDKLAASIQERKKRQAVNLAATDEFMAVQKEALELSSELPTDHVLQKQAQLKPRFEALYAKIEKQLEFQRESEQLDKYLQDKDRVVKDAKFTKATIANIKAGSNEKRGPSQEDLKGLEVQ